MMKKIAFAFLMLLITTQLFAQESNSSLTQSIHASGKIYVVVVCVMVILLGLLIFLFSMDKRLKKIEKQNSVKH